MRSRLLILISLFVLIGFVSEAYAGKIINSHLPKWLEVDLQLRHRYEFQSNFDFNQAIDDDQDFNLWRERLSLTLKPIEDVKLFYQFQDARISGDSIQGSKTAYENWVDTRQLWAEFKTDKLACQRIDLSEVTFKFGRQEFNYGSQRLVGGVDWSNVAQTFDAGKITFDFMPVKLKIDVFGGHKTNNKSPREFDDLYDGSANDILGGYYATYKAIDELTIEQYVFSRNTNGKTVSFSHVGDGEVEDYTIGVLLKGKIKDTSFDYEIETAKQVGKSGVLDVDAQMVIAILGYTFDHSLNPRISFEYDYASGDSDKADGTRKTFDNLYSTNHKFYGYMDFASLQNLHDYRFQIKIKPQQKLDLSADFHVLFVDTAKDSLYAATRAVKRATTLSADNRHVGNEVDLLANYKANDFTNILVGYSHFFAGEFLSDTGSGDDADYVYIQTTLDF